MSFAEYLSQRWQTIVVLTIEHAEFVLIAVAIAALGIAIGVAVERPPRAGRIALGKPPARSPSPA